MQLLTYGFLSEQDGFLLQPFEKEERAAQVQAEKDESCDKVDKPEKTQKKMLSRGENYFFACLFFSFGNERRLCSSGTAQCSYISSVLSFI